MQSSSSRPLIALAVCFLLGRAGGQSTAGNEAPLRFENTNPAVRYVGSQACAQCHQDVFKNFSATAMGRSASSIDAAQLALAAKPLHLSPAPGEAAPVQHSIEVFARDGKLYESEYADSADGVPGFRDTHELLYAIGANENGYTYLVRRGSRLFEAPLTYFRNLDGWDYSPGYAGADQAFSRAAPLACVACHTGRVKPIPGPEGSYADPAFTQLAIGCENCHGPGELHVRDRVAAKAITNGYDASIVNPSRLPGRLADNICMSCHEIGSARVDHSGKTPLDFRPGTPLDDAFSIFALARSGTTGPALQAVTHYQGMIASKCYRASGGQLKCITCHDPHVEPRNAPAYFRPKCLSCHQPSSCTEALHVREQTTPADNCIQCHMPKKGLTAVAHSALTDHRIVRTPGEPMPPPEPSSFTEQTGMLYLTQVPGREPDDLTVFQAYTLLSAQDPSLESKWLDAMKESLAKHPDDPWVLAQAGTYLVASGNSIMAEQGREYLRRSIQLGTTLPHVWDTLVKSLTISGKLDEAKKVIQDGLAHNPYDLDLRRILIYIYGVENNAPKQLQAATELVKVFPEADDARALVAKLSHQ